MFGTVRIYGNFLLKSSLLLSLMFLFACDSKQNSASGSDCSYEIVSTLAEVKELKPYPDGNGKIAVILDFKASVLALDDQELGALKNLHIDHDFLERNGIEIHNKYEVTVSELIRGNCDTKLTVAFDHSFE
jgi:hypothetical protein